MKNHIVPLPGGDFEAVPTPGEPLSPQCKTLIHAHLLIHRYIYEEIEKRGYAKRAAIFYKFEGQGMHTNDVNEVLNRLEEWEFIKTVGTDRYQIPKTE